MSEAQAYAQGEVSGKFSHKPTVVIFSTNWHADIVDTMVADACKELEAHGVGRIITLKVPGSFELPQAVSIYLASERFAMKYPTPDGVICFGCVVQGETPHFTFISQAAANGLEKLATRLGQMPMMFGILTTNTEQQALERANGVHSRKGQEVAHALLEMLHFREEVSGGQCYVGSNFWLDVRLMWMGFWRWVGGVFGIANKKR